MSKKYDVFVNPYNFIPLNAKGVERKTQDQLPKGLLTGHISCRLIVKAPLALPDHSTKQGQKFDFYSIAGRYAIPGSELRGCIRSVFETVTNSCLSVLDEKEKVKFIEVPVYDLVRNINSEYSHIPCKRECCPACTLFGAFGKASKIRFSDAFSNNCVIDDNYRNMPEFSSPKFSTMCFYTKNTTAKYEKGIYNSWKYKDENTQIRGRKFYFHSGNTPEVSKLGERQIAVKCAQKGDFDFKIYFEKITETELKQLLWVLTLGENKENSMLMHKIGAGRPVGYGSVKIVVPDNGLFIREIKGDQYTTETKSYTDFEPHAEKIGLDIDAVNKLLKICNFNYLDGYKVSYPLAYKGDKLQPSFKWFNDNVVKENEKKKIGYHQILPEISDDETEKPVLKSY